MCHFEGYDSLLITAELAVLGDPRNEKFYFYGLVCKPHFLNHKRTQILLSIEEY
jgi:hypothetical protein